MEEAGISEWLFTECYDAVGDLAETLNLILPNFAQSVDYQAPVENDNGLAAWMETTIVPLATVSPERQRELVVTAWHTLPADQRFVWIKLITGAFRVGVSQDLVVRALSQVSTVPAPVIAHRLMGAWKPSAAAFEQLISPADQKSETSQPYPFCLAHPVDASKINQLGSPKNWIIEWKWDGIRSQIIRREGQTYVWSRGEELITDRFPEIKTIGDLLPDGTVLDGEIVAYRDGKILSFGELQRRIGRKTVGKKLLADVPVTLIAFDIVELSGEDIRNKPLTERRSLLPPLQDAGFLVAENHSEDLSIEATWDDVAAIRMQASDLGVEGLMLKQVDSAYQVGRKTGAWWKWKIDPFTVDAVLVYAQRGSGRRASLYSDYTFAVWKDGVLVPIAKAYSGLTDEEMRKVDSFVRDNTLDKFGPVRTVTPELVFEIAFEGIQLSSRHKSGIAVRFPRILRWRHDKKPSDADNLESLIKLLGSKNQPAETHLTGERN